MRHRLALSRVRGRLRLATACVLAFMLPMPASARSPAPPASSASSATVPADGFVAARAFAHVRALARAPRPVGSASNAGARDYLVAQIRALGLVPEIQTETVQAASSDLTANVRVSLAEVHNVLVKKPGSGARGRPAVLASARYDSAAASLGAADGALSAAALLEALRALQAGPPLDNDLLFVFTDGDDVQSFGTRGFANAHPWAQRARVILRFDNIGNRGPLALVDASHADDFALKAWSAAAPRAAGSSFMAELTRDRPQRMAAGLLAAPPGASIAGAAVLQFATLQGPLGAGGAMDVPDRVATASLQHEGDTALALLHRFGNVPLPAASGAVSGQVFVTLPLIGPLIGPIIGPLHYGYGWIWPLTGLACALSVLACRRALHGRIAGSDLAHGAFGFGFMAMLATFVTHIAYESMPGLQARYAAGLLTADAGVQWQLAAFLLLPAAVFTVLQRRLQRKLGAPAAALGAILAVNAALVAVDAGAPGASLVLTWPLLSAQAAWLLLTASRVRAWTPARRTALALAGTLPTLVLLPAAAHDSLAWLSPQWLVLPSILVCTAIGLSGMALALIAQRASTWLAGAMLAGGAACATLAWAGDPPAPTLPMPNHLVYFKDTPSWQAYWMYPALPLDAWTRQIFPNTMHPYQLPYMFGVTSKPVWYAAAPRNDDVAWPDLTIEKDVRNGQVRHVEFRMRSKNRAPEITLRFQGELLRSSVNGRILTDGLYRSWKADLHGMGDRELHFAIDLPGDPGFSIFIQEHIPGLPERDLPPRPAGMRPGLLPMTGTTVASDILVFR